MNATLLAHFTEEEIKIATHQLGAHKAPSPDGFPGMFYKFFWDIVKLIVCGTTNDLQYGSCRFKALNRTFIALIPKVQAQENTNQFTPIGLCNNS
ncbi:unnamed protein product [Prunus armeniaca]|uniref:Reverse transcriptase domain-containing protein n=1 Tax=Prunus armeniaca TaxID=36596 RepID=A0A6J5V6Y5_PRUAR|nr:unnamed protein product [Prunus armeniaca]